MEPTEPITFNLNYKINGKPTDCGIKRVVDGDEYYFTVCTNINGESKYFHMHFDSDLGRYGFDSELVPEELKAVETEISDVIQRKTN